MTLYRKRPVVVEAVQWDGTIESARELAKWARAYGSGDITIEIDYYSGVVFLNVRTLEGSALVGSPGDWIIRGVEDEFYPCKPSVFAETYEDVQ